MTFFNRELKKILFSTNPNAIYVGRVCYIHLSDVNRAKVRFVTCGMADRYEALKVTVLNCNEGIVDELLLRFGDVLGTKSVGTRLISPYAWTYNDKTDWYGYAPTKKAYETLAKAVNDYLALFKQPATNCEQWEQTTL